MLSRFGKSARWIVSAVALFVLSAYVDWSEVFAAILGSKLIWLPIVLLIVFFDRFIMAVKWAMLIRATGVSISNYDAFKIYLVAGFAGSFLPQTVGTDVVKLVSASAVFGNIERLTSTVIMEKVLGLLALTVVSTIAAAWLMFKNVPHSVSLLFLDLTLILVLFGILIISLSGRLQGILKRIFARAAAQKWIILLEAVHDAYSELGTRRAILALFFFLSIAERGVLCVATYACAQAIGLSVDALFFFAIVPVIGLAAALPISIGGLGVAEGMFVLLFPLAGMAESDALALAIYSRAIGWISVLPGALLMLGIRLRGEESKECKPPLE